MIALLFSLSTSRQWFQLNEGAQSVFVTGWAATGNTILSGEPLARHIASNIDSSQPFHEILHALNGNFAVVFDSPDVIHLGVDGVRSIPLFYRQEGTTLLVSDDIRQLHRDDDAIDEESLIEFATAGYVTGSHTLFSAIAGLQSGECVSWFPSENRPRVQRYYRYLCSYDADASVEELCEAFDEALITAFKRVIETLNGQQVVVPLSGGLDSRLVAAMLKRCGYDSVVCLCYGMANSCEAVRSRTVAESLGYRWVHTPYSGGLWRNVLRSSEMRQYWSFSANGVSVPHCDEWPALHLLREKAEIADDAIFIPGHTGDFICGSHLKYVFDPRWHDAPHVFDEAMIKKHYSLWENLVTIDSIRNVIRYRLHDALGDFPNETDEDLARTYEYWEWQERQAKFIINSVRVYEFFGYSWRIPLWDYDIMEFWKSIPIALKMDKYLYRIYLASHDPKGVFQGEAPKSLWSRELVGEQLAHSNRERIKEKLRSTGLFCTILWRFKKFRRHVKEYNHHPIGLARAYGVFRYLFREPSKRHAQALLLKEFLLKEYKYGVALFELIQKTKHTGCNKGCNKRQLW